MRYGSIGTCGKRVSRIVYGCDRLESLGPARLDSAFALGINAFDTARVYHGSEQILGRWLSANDIRSDVFIITKGGHPGTGGPRSHFRAQVLLEIRESLESLGTDHVDLYLIHYDRPTLSAELIAETIDEIKEAGLALAVGLSNFTRERVEQVAAAGGHTAPGRIAAVSAQLSLPVPAVPMWPRLGSVSISGEKARGSREWYALNKIPVLAYSCLARGFFSETGWRQSTVTSVPSGAEQPAWWRYVWGSADNTERYKRAAVLAREKMATPAQVALAYVLHQELAPFAIASWGDDRKGESNVAAFRIQLSSQELQWLAVDNG